MKPVVAIVLAAAAATVIAAAQDAPKPRPQPAAQPQAAPEKIPIEPQAHAMLIYDEKKFEDVWIERATTTAFRYRETPTAIDRKIKNISECPAIYFFEPDAYRVARDLYQGRRFAEAKEEFARVREALKELSDMPNNHATLSAYYELECLRQLGDLAGLATALEGFRKAGLTRDHHIRQLDLYLLWDAVRTKSWQRLDLMCTDRRKVAMPGYQRVQVAYCHGLALEGINKPIPALNAYATAITADCGASLELVRQATLNSLRIYKANPEVQLAIKLWGTEDEAPNSGGSLLLKEAATLAETYQTILGSGKALPAEYKDLLKYNKNKADQGTAAKESTPPKAAKEGTAAK